MTTSLTEVSAVVVPRRAIDATMEQLRAAGRRGLEGIAFWVGVHSGPMFHVREAYIPRQQGHRTPQGVAVTVAGPELHRLNLYLHRNELRLIAQIHSHPTHAYHSAMDDEYAVATALGSLSLVVPDFAAAPFTVETCAVYRLQRRPWWQFSEKPRWTAVGDAPRLIRIEG
ncbi:Mov34/MPN/PAD-1 family protein [Enterovirga sp. CN4-39]|uniref:Mov34/MPN/PAD-1 family protein n=1 Tax=Enterovirga sp. CN4-39 TaxID=3400910 RepID=UPI003BFD1FBE